MAERNTWFRRPGVRVSLVISGLMLVLALAMLLFWLTTRSLFSRNDHFILRQVEIKGGQWWQGKDRALLEALQMTIGQTNLFAVNLAELRSQLEAQPNLRAAAVARLLPDTLVIDLVERVPRAILYRAEGPWVVDDSATVIDQDQCVDPGEPLPVITGFTPGLQLQSGVELSALRPALDLIRRCRLRYAWMQVRRLSLAIPNEVQISFRVNSSAVANDFTAHFQQESMGARLELLTQTVQQVLSDRNPQRDIDLRFENQVILN